MDRLERTGSPTFFINGRIPQTQHATGGDGGGGSEPRIPNLMPSINTTPPSLISQLNSAQVQGSHNTEFRMLEQRMENLETRLTTMEERISGNFETILSYLRSSKKGHSAPDLRTTNV